MVQKPGDIEAGARQRRRRGGERGVVNSGTIYAPESGGTGVRGFCRGRRGKWGKEARGRGGEFALASTISVPLSILVPKIYRLAAVQNLGGLRQTYENRAL